MCSILAEGLWGEKWCAPRAIALTPNVSLNQTAAAHLAELADPAALADAIAAAEAAGVTHLDDVKDELKTKQRTV